MKEPCWKNTFNIKKRKIVNHANKTPEMILNVWKSTDIIKTGKSMKAENFVIRADKFD